MISSLKKSPSVPALLAISNNLDVLIAFTRSDQIETVSDDVYQIPEERSSAEECVTEYQKDYGDMEEGRKRRHNADPKSWKRNKARLKRMRGEEYLGYSKPKDRKFQQDTLRQARRLGPTCVSNFCKKSKVRGCDRFSEDCRKDIHSNFWKKMTWDQRRVYVTGLVTRSSTSRKTKSASEPSRREGTLSYFLPIEKDCSNKVQVCKQMFLNTLALGSFTVQAWVKKSEFGMTSNHDAIYDSKTKTPRAEVETKLSILNNFFTSLPKLPSHYARKDTSKLFIEPIYRSLTDLNKAYQKYCTETSQPNVSRFTFEKNFHEKNLSLFTLKKDMCDTCSSYNSGNLNESDYQIHVIKKNRARQEKEEDKKKAAAGEFLLLTMDLEAVKICPYLTASALYFKTKLTCHNFTVFNLVTKHCTCYWFDETSADLTSSTFATFLIDYLERHCIPHQLPIVIYSDGCTYQNRNSVLANALLLLSKKHNVIIMQKFLEPGHTQMECDSVHSAIERKLKNREIHLPSDYVTITKEARSTNPYEAINVDHEFVKDYARPENMLYKSIRPGRKAGDPQVVDIRVIKYNTMTIEVKLGFDEEWIPLPHRPRLLASEAIYPQLHPTKIPITVTKYNHLQQLKAVLPKDCHNFYDTLPFV